MEPNFLAILVAALSSFVVGFIWYNPKVFGTIWMREIGMTEEKARQSNMVKVFGLTFVFAFMLAFMMPTLVIHQVGAMQLAGGNANDEAFLAYMQVHGEAFRTFKHGALHGCIASLFIVLPVIATNALFEQKSFKYVAITSGYWVIVMTLMGAIICGWK
ncbi:putative membrane protein YqjE [Flavobacterium arsenatis]|uniref:Membrane protein YqjE n=1 Tax=Flavobacterium arsenatis TaxID=1484332 RepID=A0ABU1TLV7_9FLAO|nr:DUF1761 domain-containing protein [Flavobacterium arsenatis]MDR6966413.1 putative membrane protein YqjE [Flavobacterium arsenatis]